MITCYRRQFAVGQGGLHFGIIKYPYEYMGIKSYNRFAYLYDCGCSGGKRIYKNVLILLYLNCIN